VRISFAVLLLATTASAQSTGPAFDVASVKRVVDVPVNFPGVLLQPGGRVTSPGTSVRQLILVAYGLQDLQLAGGPSWLGSERYAIEARTGADATRASVRSMVKSLLTERFQLVAHFEKRELPTLALLPVTRGTLGRRLRRSGPDCTAPTPPPGVPLPPPPPPGLGSDFTPVLPQDPLGPSCGAISFPGWISGRRMTMAQLTVMLTQVTRRIVVDESGLGGEFDLDLTFMPDQPVQMNGGAAPPSLAMSDRPALMTAIQEDLGLKLDARRRDVDVLVIDRIERPSEN
jgi:uncharacterized protein (TIGR03435 family)